jgi:quercetin dioxygenase-like cupin family protein
MKLEHWNLGWGEPTEANIRRRLESEGYEAVRYVYPPGTYFPDHPHSADKKDAVVSGRLKIRIKDRYLLGPGDILELAAGTAHSAEVIGDAYVVSLDASKR